MSVGKLASTTPPPPRKYLRYAPACSDWNSLSKRVESSQTTSRAGLVWTRVNAVLKWCEKVRPEYMGRTQIFCSVKRPLGKDNIRNVAWMAGQLELSVAPLSLHLRYLSLINLHQLSHYFRWKSGMERKTLWKCLKYKDQSKVFIIHHYQYTFNQR